MLPAQSKAGITADLLPEIHADPAFTADLRVGAARRDATNTRSGWAPIEGGMVDGALLRGVVQPGRVEWLVGESGQGLTINASFAVLRDDGVRVEVRDRAVHPAATTPMAAVGICTAPQLLDAADQQPVVLQLLVGRLDASGFGAGQVRLRVFRVE